MEKFLKYISFTILITLIGLNSCTERIDIDLDTDRVRLVVEANITEIEDKQFVKLTETADYFSNIPPKGVTNAVIQIDNGDHIFTLSESNTEEGLYLMPDGFMGNQEESYGLSIKLKNEIGGHSEFTAQTKMPLLSDDIDSISVEWFTQFGGWAVRLYAQEPSREDFYMFSGIRNGELITDSIHEVNISDDRLYNGNNTHGAIVLFLNEEQLEVGDTFTLILSNITKEYASFVTEIQTEIQANDPMFSGPPVNVSSNISNEALGWFTAYPSAFTSAIVKEIPKD